MRFDTKSAARLALIAAVTVGMAACSTPKKPEPPRAAIPTPPPTQPQSQPSRPPLPPRSEPLPPPSSQSNIPAPPVPGSTQDFVVNAGERVYFDYDSHDIRADASPILDAQAAWLVRYPQVAVRIEGNADERGTREYNFALGSERANAVRDYLVRKGVAASRMETVSYGKERPIVEGTDEASLAKNRNGHTAIVGGAR